MENPTICTQLGPVINTQFCPNPSCRQIFHAEHLEDINNHFANGTLCGQWLMSIRFPPAGYPYCPNPNCRCSFDSPEESVRHLSTVDSACGNWLKMLHSGQFPPYPTATTGASEEFFEEEQDNETDDNADSEYQDNVDHDINRLDNFWQAEEFQEDNEGSDYPEDEESRNEGNSGNMYRTGLPSDICANFHPNVPVSKPGGFNLLQRIDADVNAQRLRKKHPYYPFASKADWELGSWLSSGALSQREIDHFLKLDYVKAAIPSFTSARDLQARIESLPPVPQWHYQEIVVPHYKTQTPMILYWRDGLEIIEHLYSNPVFASCIQSTPYQAFDTAGERVYGEFMSGNLAWEIQSRLPVGHTFLGVIGASDKTPLTFGTGNKEMHPLLLSIANIEAGVRMKATSHSFALAAYLPIPKFVDVPKTVQSILAARVYHTCISIVTENLKLAEKEGKVMSNPWGGLNAVHTPLVSWIADYPEQLTIACTAAKQSAVSTASAVQFGDPFPHPPRTRDFTLNAIRSACTTTDPWSNIPQFYKTAQLHHLNGVYLPFWADWGLADPSEFLTPDALHQWHKMFYDHILKWVINIMGGPELDYRLAALQPRVGVRHWVNGVSTLKQCTGREHQELEKLIVTVAAGAVPNEVLCAIRALIEFIFQAQNIYHYDETLHALEEALHEFHHYKQFIIAAGGRCGKNGALNHYYIPKLETMQQVVRSIRLMGAAYQYTSDITERCHITLVKRPYRLSNRRNFHTQCCRFLDREDKRRFFRLFVMLKAAGAPLLNEMEREAQDMAIHYPESTWISSVLPDEKQAGISKEQPTLFTKVRSHISYDHSVAFHLTMRPHIPSISIAEAAEKFHLPDLRAAIGDFYSQRTYTQRNGRRESTQDCSLPFTHICVWYNVRLQQRSAQDERNMIPIQTVQALPPTEIHLFGRCHTVLVGHADGQKTSQTGVEKCGIMQVRVIFQPITHKGEQDGPLLFYGENFKFSTDHVDVVNGEAVLVPAPYIDMFLLHRHFRADGSRMGDIMELSDIRQEVQLVPKFGQHQEKCNLLNLA